MQTAAAVAIGILRDCKLDCGRWSGKHERRGGVRFLKASYVMYLTIHPSLIDGLTSARISNVILRTSSCLIFPGSEKHFFSWSLKKQHWFLPLLVIPC